MTDAHPHNGVPGVIVVAETTIHDLLANSGVAWDCQHQIATIQQMWEDLGNGRLDNERSAAVVFSDTVPDAADLVAAASTMAPFAVTVVVAWQEDKAAALKAAIQAQIAANAAADPNLDPNAPVYFVPARTGRTVLDGVLHAVRGSIAHPGQFRINVDQPLTRISDTIAFNPAAATPTAGPGGLPAAPPPLPAVSVAAPGLPPVTAATETRPPQQVDATAPTRPDQITIAVTSSKGGSGKSTSALMLATTIAHASRAAGAPLKVALVDMDTRDGQLGSLIGKFLPTALNVRSEPRIDQQTLTKYLIHDPKLGIDCLLAPVRPRTADDLGPDFYRHVIRILKTTHDVVIMDTSVNYLDPLIATVCLPESTAILFVTTMAQTAVQGMARALREITEPVEQGGMGISRSRIGVVVNQAVAGVGMETDQVIQAALKVRIIGSIPMASRDVLLATNNNAMHVLTQHPYLAPAYFNLAKVCLRDRPLAPATKEMGQGAAEAPQQPPAAAGPQPAPVDVPAGQPPAPVAVPVGAGPVGGPGPDVVPDGPGDGRKKRGLFGRRG